MKPARRHPYRPYILTWFALALLLCLEIVASRVLRLGSAAPAIGVIMAGLVGVMFMNLRTASGLARIFAVATIVWLVIILGMGVMDPVTRTDVDVPQHTF